MKRTDSLSSLPELVSSSDDERPPKQSKPSAASKTPVSKAAHASKKRALNPAESDDDGPPPLTSPGDSDGPPPLTSGSSCGGSSGPPSLASDESEGECMLAWWSHAHDVNWEFQIQTTKHGTRKLVRSLQDKKGARSTKASLTCAIAYVRDGVLLLSNCSRRILQACVTTSCRIVIIRNRSEGQIGVLDFHSRD